GVRLGEDIGSNAQRPRRHLVRQGRLADQPRGSAARYEDGALKAQLLYRAPADFHLRRTDRAGEEDCEGGGLALAEQVDRNGLLLEPGKLDPEGRKQLG